MSETGGTVNFLVLATGLFPDRGTIEEALNTTRADTRRIELDPQAMTDEEWDQVVGLILKAKKVMTI